MVSVFNDQFQFKIGFFERSTIYLVNILLVTFVLFLESLVLNRLESLAIVWKIFYAPIRVR